ncbi:hypothetical protein ACFE04_022114 [Oxalis oulophora]
MKFKIRCFRCVQEPYEVQQKENDANNKELTLAEWFLVLSPALNKSCSSREKLDKSRGHGGEYYVFPQNLLRHRNNKISCPSLSNCKKMVSFSENTESSMEMLLKKDHESLIENLSLEMMFKKDEDTCVKVKKKKVSFRLPIEADIFIFYSPKHYY